MKKRYYQKKFIEQKLIGLTMLIISITLIIVAASSGFSEDNGGTAAVVVGSFGSYLTFTKHIIIY